MKGLIAILSDFGLKDHYVGTIHGIIKDVAPEAEVVDITHYVRPFDIVDGALKLKWSYKYFPVGTIFLCLVDPDPTAIPIIVSTEKYFLVCPNNGIGSLMFEEEPPEAVYKITAEHYFIEGKGNFRGRNQLTPIAAELSRLQSPIHLGEEIDLKLLKRFKLPDPKPLGNGTYEAIVIDVDYFGNLILNLTYNGKLPKSVEVNGVKIERSSEGFGGFQKGELFISVHPENHIQIVAYMASAAKLLKAARGAKVKVSF
ncbi:MAG: SAM-dependent chlorinase/fluorinase [Desulfurobacteriaceae bacterium]